MVGTWRQQLFIAAAAVMCMWLWQRTAIDTPWWQPPIKWLGFGLAAALGTGIGLALDWLVTRRRP
jgi:hypothetical protein